MSELKPSKEMWDYYFEVSWKRKEVTPLSVCSAIADKIYGYGISHTAKEVLKDLGLLTEKGNVNKKGKEALAHYLHEKFHRGDESGLKIINPYEES